MGNNPASKRRTLWRLFGFLAPWRLAYFACLFALAILATIERTFIAYVIKIFVDSIVGKDLSMLWNSVKIWMIFLLGWIPASALFSYLWRSVLVKAVANLRQRLFSRMQRLPLAYHEQRHSADLISVLTNDVAAAEQTFQQDMYNLVAASLMGVSAAVYMLVLNWQLALVTIFCGLVPLIINTAFARPLRKTGEVIQERLGGVSERLADLLAGTQVVRTYGLSAWILGRFSKANRELLESSLRRVNLNASLEAANYFGGTLMGMGPLAIGAYMVLTGHTTFGILVALIQLNNPIQYLVYSLGGTISRIQGSLAAADRILELIDAAPEPEKYSRVGLEPDPTPGTALEFKDVHFGYDSAHPILQGMSFTALPGQTAAFVGPSGGGKSTIFKLLLGCYPVREGAVFVHGRSVNDYYLSELRSLFAYIPQDAYLYTGSIMENIHYGRPSAAREEVLEAARAAYAHDFISEFPDGYWTKVGERGARLSGGQRQRIAIARALLKNAPILLLDEATSALDSESEEIVQRALEVLMRGRTVLVIAHRLSTIEHADIIYTVSQGQVVESGSQAELLQRRGLFHHLYNLQFKYDEPAAA